MKRGAQSQLGWERVQESVRPDEALQQRSQLIASITSNRVHEQGKYSVQLICNGCCACILVALVETQSKLVQPQPLCNDLRHSSGTGSHRQRPLECSRSLVHIGYRFGQSLCNRESSVHTAPPGRKAAAVSFCRALWKVIYWLCSQPWPRYGMSWGPALEHINAALLFLVVCCVSDITS